MVVAEPLSILVTTFKITYFAKSNACAVLFSSSYLHPKFISFHDLFYRLEAD